jgi:hypothetical protein
VFIIVEGLHMTLWTQCPHDIWSQHHGADYLDSTPERFSTSASVLGTYSSTVLLLHHLYQVNSTKNKSCVFGLVVFFIFCILASVRFVTFFFATWSATTCWGSSSTYYASLLRHTWWTRFGSLKPTRASVAEGYSIAAACLPTTPLLDWHDYLI